MYIFEDIRSGYSSFVIECKDKSEKVLDERTPFLKVIILVESSQRLDLAEYYPFFIPDIFTRPFLDFHSFLRGSFNVVIYQKLSMKKQKNNTFRNYTYLFL